MKTFSAKPKEVRREWFVIDATDKVLGRLATQVATRLRGKHKPEYTPHIDTGDHIVIINCEKVAVTGNKEEGKIYHRHTGFPGGIKEATVRTLRERSPEQIIQLAVRGMLPKTSLGRSMFKKLHVYAGNEHKHAAQQPKVLEV
jgi:large subunit ribosomal protein L13